MKWRWLKYLGLAIIGLGLAWFLFLFLTLQNAAKQPVDTLFVLGGSIRREIYLTELVETYPDAKALISNGSVEPCIFLIFDRAKAPKEQVWLEKCARNTFGNFYYSTPILKRWNARHVKLITSETHLPRALWMAKIHLGAQGIWVDLDIAQETGVPGNREFWWKTLADVGRSLLWGVVSQIVQPNCDRIIYLPEVDMNNWLKKDFECEHQAQLDSLIEQLKEEQNNETQTDRP